MSDKLTVTANLINDNVKFSGASRNNNEVFIDAIQPLGEGDGYTPLELFLLTDVDSIFFLSCDVARAN